MLFGCSASQIGGWLVKSSARSQRSSGQAASWRNIILNYEPLIRAFKRDELAPTG